VAIPSAKPNSLLTCDTDAADPAFSGGAALMTMLVPSVISGPEPRLISANPATMPTAVSDCVMTTSPAVATIMPAAIRWAGRMRRAAIGATCTLTMPASAAGTSASPASSGESPSTSCRNWVSSTIVAPGSIVLTSMLTSAVDNDRLANSRRSSSGSARRRCRRTKVTPISAPNARAASGAISQPLRASSLRP
jgi:hypothetical protein